MSRRRVLLLGCTGSIGRQALEVIAALPNLSVAGLVAGSDWQTTLTQARAFNVSLVALHDESAAAAARTAAGQMATAGAGGAPAALRVLAGDAGIAEIIENAAQTAREDGVPLIVLNGIVGAAGLRATMVALRCGATLALANKESMVAGGPFVLQTARESGAAIIPVDSEHSAIFQCLAAGRPGAAEAGGPAAAGLAAGIGPAGPGAMGQAAGEAGPALANPLLPPEEILLTGSGGPFRGFSREQLAQVTREQALHHPNWVMGPKVTIDSATLMNKGLEVIEAHYLFGVPYEQIRVVIHPQSIVHSLVRYGDGAVLAHLGVPDMRTPIGYALTYPQRAPLPMVSPLDLSARELSFLPPDTTSFRCLALAQAAGQTAAAAQAAGRSAGAGAPIVLNAANEIAVHAFLAGSLSFLGIAALVEQTLEQLADVPVGSLDDVFALDSEARRVAAEQLGV